MSYMTLAAAVLRFGRPRRPFSSTRSCLRLLRDFAQRAGSITPLQLEVLCRCSTHTHARRRRLPRCRFAPPRPNRHLLCGAAAAPSSPQSNISTLASFASRRHFLDGPRLGPPRVSSGSLPSTPFCAAASMRTRHWSGLQTRRIHASTSREHVCNRCCA